MLGRSASFPSSGFEPRNYRRRVPKTRYVCANRQDGKPGCREFVNLPEAQIKNGRIPRCKCGQAMVAAKPQQKRRDGK